jgi:hypothetical protein
MYATGLALPNRPLLRLKNFLDDRPVLRKRWLTEAVDISIFTDSLLIPGDRSVRTKKVDPSWRKRWSWVVLKVDCLDAYRPIVLDRELEGRDLMLKLLFPLKTPIFALRVGPRPMRVVAVDVRGVISIPSLFTLGNTLSDKVSLLRKSELDAFSRKLEQSGFVEIIEI